MKSAGLARVALPLFVVFASVACAAPQDEGDDATAVEVDTNVRPQAVVSPEPGPINPCIYVPGPLPAPAPGPGDLDKTFGCNGTTTYGNGTQEFQIRGLAVLPDDKILAVGSVYTQVGNTNDVFIARYTANGSLDSTFGTGGTLVYNFTGVVGGAESAEAVVVHPDGHFLVGGGFRTEDGLQRKAFLMRFDASGALDPAFGTGGTITMTTMTIINSLSLQGESLVAFGERCNGADSTCVAGIGRYSNTTGALESGFGMNGTYTMQLGGSAPSRAQAGIVTSTKMVVAGSTRVSGTDDAAFARFDGLWLDPTFDTTGVQSFAGAGNDVAYGIAAYGSKYVTAEGGSAFAVRRLTSAGLGDSTFGPSGRRTVAFAGTGGGAQGIVTTGTKVVAAGFAYTSTLRSRMAVVRFTSTGALDTTFSDDGLTQLTAGGDDAWGNAIVVQSTGRIVVGGWRRIDGAKKRAALVRVLN